MVTAVASNQRQGILFLVNSKAHNLENYFDFKARGLIMMNVNEEGCVRSMQ